MMFEFSGEAANVDNFAKKLEAAVKDKAEVGISQRSQLSCS